MDPKQKNFNLRLDLRVVVAVLGLVILGMLLLWMPWEASNGRTVSVTGDAKIAAKPDEFQFFPSYNFKNVDKNKALGALTKKSDQIVTKLKELGVPDSDIKTNASGSDMPIYIEPAGMKNSTYTLQLTVSVSNQDLAQKVQDYLITTSPSGAVTPIANFSDAKKKELENQARDQATKDARAKVDQMSKNLGFSVGKIKSVTDNTGFGLIPERGIAGSVDSSGGRQLVVQPGENELSYSVVVVYFIR